MRVPFRPGSQCINLQQVPFSVADDASVLSMTART
jgi:hypothetical protein